MGEATTAFTDTKNRRWNLAITHADAVRVKRVTGVAIYGLLDKEFEGLTNLLGDPEKLVDVVACLLTVDLRAADVTDEEFGRSLNGPVVEAMGEVFLAALADFFPSQGARETVAKVMEMNQRTKDLMLQRLRKNLETLTPEKIAVGIEQMAQVTRKKKLKDSPGNGPAKLASIPET